MFTVEVKQQYNTMPRKSVVRLTGRPDMTVDVYRGRKTIIQQQQQLKVYIVFQYQAGKLCPVCSKVVHVSSITFLIDFKGHNLILRTLCS